jgi:ABC-type phosphate transport system substrate-binding protein
MSPMRRIAFLVLVVLVGGSAWADDFVLVRNAANPTAHLRTNEVKDLYTGKRKQWSNGESVQVVLTHEDSPELAWLASTFFGVNARTLLTKIKQEVFKGEMTRPISVENEQDTIEKVKANKGGIGVVSAAATKSLPPSVAVIQVEQ